MRTLQPAGWRRQCSEYLLDPKDDGLRSMSVTFGALLVGAKNLLAVMARAVPLLRPLLAQKSAAAKPESFVPSDKAMFELVLRRLQAADPSDSLFVRSYDATANKLITPDFLQSGNVQDWLEAQGVKDDLERAVRAAVQGHQPPTKVTERLTRTFMDVGCASVQEAEPIVKSIVTMLAADLTGRIADRGTAALVVAVGRDTNQGIEELSAKVDALISGSGGGLNEAHTTPLELDGNTEASWRDAFRSASNALLSWPKTLADGKHLRRPELAQLLETVRTKSRCTVVLLGVPGSGKSALLAELGDEVSVEPKTAVLAIKSDVLDSTVTTEEELRRDLGLPELPSTMLAQLASTGRTVLLIDQLDALAGHLDTKTGRLSALLNLVKAASRIDNLSIVLSCRSFEFSHDMRLSRIDAESIDLELPPWDDVVPILESNGISVSGWNSDAREVLRVPQQLNTYLKLREEGITEPFTNYSTMLDRLWDARVLNAPNGPNIASVGYAIAERMADTEALWLSPSRFDDRMNDVRALISVGVLTTSREGAIGFSHQTVFEHVLARSFAKTDGRLSSYVAARSQSLFVRPKPWTEGPLRTVWASVATP